MPNSFEPLGFLNFSKINKARLKFKYNSVFETNFYSNNKSFSLLSIYAQNYNIIKMNNGEVELVYGGKNRESSASLIKSTFDSFAELP